VLLRVFGDNQIGGTQRIQTLGGIGEISFGPGTSSSEVNEVDAYNILSIGPGILIHGRNGLVGGYNNGAVNQGTITADIPGGTIELILVTNQGHINVVPGAAILYSRTFPFVQTDGELRVDGTLTTADDLDLQGGTLTGTGTLNIGGALNIGGGTGAGATASLTGLALNPGTIRVSAGGTVSVSALASGSVVITTGGTLRLRPTATRATNSVTSLQIAGSGTLDLANHSLLTNTAPATIKSYLATAYTSNQDWSGPGLTSSVASSNPTKYSLAYASGSDQSAQDAGIPVAPGQTLVQVTLTGDANMDGTVDFFDISQLLGYKYNTGQQASYTDGDLNYDGVVDFFDLSLLLSANYNTGEQYLGAAAASPAAQSVVPEPAGSFLAALPAVSLLRRRRRRRLRRPLCIRR
jgi:hypothetical protein